MTAFSNIDFDREAFAIVAVVAEAHDVAPRVVLGENRQRGIVEMRRKCAWLMRAVLDLSLNEIGRQLGGYDAKSVSEYVAQADTRIKADPLYENELDRLRSRSAQVIGEYRRFDLIEDDARPIHDALAVARRILRTPRGELRASGAEVRALAEAYVDHLLAAVEARP